MSWTLCFLIVALSVHLFGRMCLGSAGALAARWQTAHSPVSQAQMCTHTHKHKHTGTILKHTHQQDYTQSHTHWPQNAGYFNTSCINLLSIGFPMGNKPRLSFQSWYEHSHFPVSCQYQLPGAYHLSKHTFIWELVYESTVEWQSSIIVSWMYFLWFSDLYWARVGMLGLVTSS